MYNMFIIDFSKKHKTAKISNLSQPLFDKQPISSTKLQQSFVYVCHWFQQKPQNNEKTQLVKGLHPIGWDGKSRALLVFIQRISTGVSMMMHNLSWSIVFQLNYVSGVYLPSKSFQWWVLRLILCHSCLPISNTCRSNYVNQKKKFKKFNLWGC